MSNSFSLAIGEELIRVVDGQLSKDKIIINAAAYDNINENIYVDNSGKISIDTANKIVKLINDAGISKRQVNIIIPDGFSYTRIIEMPLLSDKELLSAIKYQADQFIPIAIDNLDLDAITIYQDKSNNKQYILIVACVKTLIDKISKLVESSGLIPISIENEAASTLRIFRHLHLNNDSGDIIFLNFGSTNSTICVYDPINKFPKNIHNFPIGLNIFQKDMKANFTVDDKKIKDILSSIGFSDNDPNFHLEKILSSPLTVMSDEINRFILGNKVNLNTSSKQIYLFGEGINIKNLDGIISKYVKASVTLLNIQPIIAANTVSNFFNNDWPIFISVLGGVIE